MVDTVQLAIRTQNRIDRAVRGWRAGQPTDEIAFLNRLTEQLFSIGACAVGGTPFSLVLSRFTVLHRKGPQQTDLFGSDLAVTVSIPSADRRKTAFFQLKKSTSHKLTLKKAQLEQATTWAPIGERSWVLSTDEHTGAVRLESVKPLLAACATVKTQKAFSSLSWTPSARWILDWLDCRIGPPSRGTNIELVEALLSRFVPTDFFAPPDLAPGSISDLDAILARFPRRWVPARVWAEVEIRPVAA